MSVVALRWNAANTKPLSNAARGSGQCWRNQRKSGARKVISIDDDHTATEHEDDGDEDDGDEEDAEGG